jgi:hypothetical protein
MRRCAVCHGDVEDQHRFCPCCGAAQRIKLVQFFRGHRSIHPSGERMLRVSRYLGDDDPHVRFSVWNDRGIAEAAISLDEQESQRLAEFVSAGPGQGRLGALVAQLRADVEAAFTLRR